MQFEIPILLLNYNRPNNTIKLIERLKIVKPEKLYVFCDGPKINDDVNIEKISEVKVILKKNIDWNCEVKYKYPEINLGCGLGVSKAITWAFESTEKLIILEDDCIPHESFFNFCKEMLIKYENDTRIMHIAGTRWSEEYKLIPNVSYFFSKIAHIWGWATWKRAWEQYDFQLKDWEEFEHTGYLKAYFNKEQSKFWVKTINDFYKKKQFHTWDYQWQFTLFKNNGLSIVPNVNLISNIGISGEHSSGKKNKNFHKNTYEWKLITPPKLVLPNNKYDNYHTKYHFSNQGFLKKLINKIIKK